MTSIAPTDLKITDDNRLQITWSDGQQRIYSLKELRDRCPCATCREKRKAAVESPAALLPVISAEEAQPLAINGMKPVGNYAYSIAFSDGHDTGIFSFDFLLGMGDKAKA